MAVSRPTEFRIGDKRLQLPVYFPSISSVKTALRPKDYLEILSAAVGLNGQYLVSAFDLAGFENPTEAARMLQASSSKGAVTLMDSGNYESFWNNSQHSWTQQRFHQALRAYPCDLAFCFDMQTPPENALEHVALVVSRWRDDQAAAGGCQVLPIIHGKADALPGLCAAVALETGVALLAVPERRLGDGIIARSSTVRAIRAELDKLDRYVAIHLLGTGNPVSIALYAAMGADSFDGLEWCQTVVDHETALLFHLSQADFFAAQTEWAESGLSFHPRTLAHNLVFFTAWMRRLQDALSAGRMVDFCRHNFPDRIFQQCATAFEWTAT